MVSQKDSAGGPQHSERNWSLRTQRLLLSALGIYNFREAWLGFDHHPVVSVLGLGLSLIIAVTLVMTWPKKRDEVQG